MIIALKQQIINRPKKVFKQSIHHRYRLYANKPKKQQSVFLKNKIPELLTGSAIVIRKSVYIPQIVKIVKTKSSNDLCTITYMLLIFVMLIEFPYSIKIKNKMGILANILGILQNAIMIAIIWKFKK